MFYNKTETPIKCKFNMLVCINNHIFFLFTWYMLANQYVSSIHVAYNAKLFSIPWSHQTYLNVYVYNFHILPSFFKRYIQFIPLVKCILRCSYKLISFHILWFVNSFTFGGQFLFGWLERRCWNIVLYITNLYLFECYVSSLSSIPPKRI